MNRLAALAAMVMLAVAGCATSSAGSRSSGSPTASTGGPLTVVASTNVYGDIVKTIGGTTVRVISIIDNPAKDPHEYEADAQTQLALSKAQLEG